MGKKIDLSSFSIQKKWIEEVAPNYFNVDDISMLKTGLFGYINEVLANSVEDSLHMQTILSKEIFPNKAVLPDSIYAYSALADFTDFYAHGAEVPIVMMIPKAELLKFAKLNPITNNMELVISKNSQLVIDNKIPFIFDYDIKIICRYSKNDYIISAQYVMDVKNEISSINSPFISSVVLNDDVYLRLNARQLKRNLKSFNIYSNDVAENISFEVEYDERLAGFNVLYKPNAYTEETELLSKHLVNSVIPENSKKFCLYSMSSTNKITISFSTHPSYFRPSFNSELIVETFTTIGEEGNFEYDGENNTLTLVGVDESIDLSSINAHANVIGNSTKGKNQPTLAEIKQLVMKEFSTRKNIITEIDLERYFEGKTGNSGIYFCKKRDDIIRRMYTAFILLRNQNKEVIPTNTLDTIVYQDEFDNYVKGNPVLTLKAGTIFEGCQGMDTFKKVDGKYDWQTLIQKDSNLVTTYPGSEADKRTNYLYGTPYLIKVNTNPLFMSYYLNSIYEDNSLAYVDMDPNSYEEFIMSKLSITRNAVKEDYYTLTTHVNTTVDISNMFTTTIGPNGTEVITGINPLSENDIQLYGIFEEDGNVTGYIKFEPTRKEKNTVYYKAKLATDDYINTDDCINIVNSVFSPSASIENLRSGFSLGNDRVKMYLCVYYNGYNYANRKRFNKQIPNMNNYTLCNTYITENNIQLFKNLNSIMNSTVNMRISETKEHSGFYYKFRKVPLIRYMYMENDDNMREIVSILTNTKDMLTEVIPNMENNFNLDSKFYNTYGESKYFTIGRQKTSLDMTSISLTLNVKLNMEVNSDIVEELKNYIVNYIESANNTETGFLYISNLTRSLEQEFSEINYIEFVGFNDYDASQQIIENNFTDLSKMTREQVINFVPEYLNINRHIALDSGELMFEPRIFLNFI